MSAVIDAAVAELSAKLAGGFDGIAKFVIPGEGSIMLDGAGVRAGDGEADVTLTASAEVFEQLLAGDLSAASAFMTGKLTVDGSMGLAMKLGQVLGVTEAPLFNDLAEGPADGRAVWLKASDGVRVRAAVWNPKAPKGTVFLLPGRTEYVEKYGRAASELAGKGYCTLSVDWRGQGMADRALADPMNGHVSNFAEYQDDLDTLIGFANTAGLPQPFYLLPHSMGGCIALRALMRGLDFKAASFSAPMWGILMAAWVRPIAHVLTTASRWLYFNNRYAPGTSDKAYVIEAPFAGNTLTTDPEMWDYMKRQAIAHPDLSLAGPSYGWLKAALVECAALARMPSPKTPTIVAVGLQERIIDTAPVHARMARWPGGKLDLYPAAEHELMMERPATRTTFLHRSTDLFDAHR